MKRIVLSLLSLLLAASVSAQVCEGLNVVTFRVGDNSVSSPDAGTPTLSITYEYEFLEDAFDIESLCLGAGAQFGFRSYRRTLAYSGFYHAYKNLMYALRATAHYDILGEFFGMHSDHIDTYATLSFGMEREHHAYREARTNDIAYNKEGNETVPGGWRNLYRPGLQVGCRYWFTPNLGATVEAGFDGFSFFNVGVSACF